MKLIDVSSLKHPNTFTMVDDEDYEHLNQWRWSIDKKGYVRRVQQIDGKGYTFLMHREILQPPPDMLGDHRFGDKLDNRRENLRICTNTENSRNRKPTLGRSLPKGVDWHASERRFRARIKVNKREVFLGYFPTASEADSAYIEASKKYHGEFARLNTAIPLPWVKPYEGAWVGTETKAQQYERERAILKNAGWESRRAYGRSGPFCWRRPGEVQWMTRAEAIKTITPPGEAP